MLWRRKKKPSLEEVRRGERLDHAKSMTAEEAFEILIKNGARYPVKMYLGRHAEVLFKSEDRVYWGFPKAGFSKTFVKRLFWCNASQFNALSKQLGNFTLSKGLRMVARWFTENVEEPEAEQGHVLETTSNVSVVKADNGFLLMLDGVYLFYNEEVTEVEKKNRVYRYRKAIPVVKYSYKACFSDGNGIEKMDINKINE